MLMQCTASSMNRKYDSAWVRSVYVCVCVWTVGVRVCIKYVSSSLWAPLKVSAQLHCVQYLKMISTDIECLAYPVGIDMLQEGSLWRRIRDWQLRYTEHFYWIIANYKNCTGYSVWTAINFTFLFLYLCNILLSSSNEALTSHKAHHLSSTGYHWHRLFQLLLTLLLSIKGRLCL